jgi:hypothetical protein
MIIHGFAGIVADGAIAAIRLPPSLDGLYIKYPVFRTDLASQPWIFARKRRLLIVTH